MTRRRGYESRAKPSHNSADEREMMMVLDTIIMLKRSGRRGRSYLNRAGRGGRFEAAARRMGWQHPSPYYWAPVRAEQPAEVTA